MQDELADNDVGVPLVRLTGNSVLLPTDDAVQDANLTLLAVLRAAGYET